jgi:hypothetical protein
LIDLRVVIFFFLLPEVGKRDKKILTQILLNRPRMLGTRDGSKVIESKKPAQLSRKGDS